MTRPASSLGRVSCSVRPLTSADLDASRQLGWEAFGAPATATTDIPTEFPAGMRPWGLFDGDVLAARMVGREYQSHFGGALVSPCGTAGVATKREYRGRGLLTPLFGQTLRGARERGAAISTLFPTAPGIYRRFGYETVGDFVTVELPAASLAEPPAGEALRVRRAVADDFEAVRRVYAQWVSAQNGPLTRTGPSFPATAENFIGSFTGVSVAVDEEDRIHGYVSWNRGQGYGEDACLDVGDLIATRAEATRALLALLGSFRQRVTPRVRIDTSSEDLARLLIPTAGWRVVDPSPYMLRLLDLPQAFGCRRLAPHVEARLEFRLEDEFLRDLDGD